jgi:hypothetical protein
VKVESVHPLENFALKVNRANEHLDGLRSAVEGFVQSDFYETATEFDYKRRLVARVKNVEQPPLELAVLIGDAIHNLRSSLDNLAYALATAHTGKLPPGVARACAFPIFETGPLFRGEKKRGAAPKMRAMAPRTRAAIERLQPYHRRKHPELELLWILEELSNLDKHRLGALTSAAMAGSSYRLSGTGAFRVEGLDVISGALKEKAVVARFYGEFAPPPAVKVEANIVPDILFDKSIEAKSARGVPVVDALYGIRDVIVGRVLPELGNELARLFPRGQFRIEIGDELPDHRRHDLRGYA